MKHYKIASIPGDGIGPECMKATQNVLNALTKKIGTFTLDFKEYNAGDEYKAKTGVALPPETIQGVKEADATLFVAVGNTAKEVILPLRQMYNCYANLRPAKAYPGVKAFKPNLDLMIFRENTECLYKMVGYQGDGWGVNLRIITKEASERIARYAFEWGKKNKRKKVTAVHKANVLDLTDNVFLEATRKIASEYPEIKYDEAIVDACAMKLILSPESFDIIVTTNMFGDILSDEAAGLVGGLGMAPSGNIGDKISIFEPVHGSAPDITGKNIANPTATILSAAMMLDWLGEKEAAKKLENAVMEVLKEGKVVTPDLGGKASTDQMAQAVINTI
ncbi:isocitrate/isopropylmalate dehydrogenase family protein [Candidatus Bathyarchaeota archaeon]|nr:isocitrate/isopropylmalate dehydrogenase family protein [Candidatus Bathyarchaeota archaeon]